MIALPFIFFCIWFIVAFRQRGLDVFTLILLLYAATSLCSILLDMNDFYSDSCPKMPSLGIMAPMLYISLLSFCILPFADVKDGLIKRISGFISEKRFNIVVIGYFVIFLIVLVVSATRIEEILTSNSLAQIRGEQQYEGVNISFYDHLHGIPRYICVVCHILAPSSYIMIPLFFLGIVRFKKGALYSLMAILGSMTMLLEAINIVDRSNFVYWVLIFFSSYVFFRRQLSLKANLWFILLALFLVGVMAVYFVSVTISRFEERDAGTQGGIILYAGESYINFCNFFNYLIFNSPHRPEVVLLPNFNHYILKGPSYFEYARQLSQIYHHNVANFSTFIGLIMSVSGFWITIIYCLVFHAIARLAVWRKSISRVGLRKFIFMWTLLLNVILGLFGYFYMNTGTVLAAVIWWLIGLFLSHTGRKMIIRKIIVKNGTPKSLGNRSVAQRSRRKLHNRRGKRCV